MADLDQFLQVQRHSAEGYAPLVFSAGWQAAILNWEPPIDLASLSEIERHAQTDEVFVLWRGRAALFVQTGANIALADLEPGAVYTVTRGTWHNLVASRDVSLVIVENRDTHVLDTQLRPLEPQELAQVRAQLPEWARREN